MLEQEQSAVQQLITGWNKEAQARLFVLRWSKLQKRLEAAEGPVVTWNKEHAGVFTDATVNEWIKTQRAAGQEWLVLRLPVPPSMNDMYKRGPKNVFISDKVKKYRSLVETGLSGKPHVLERKVLSPVFLRLHLIWAEQYKPGKWYKRDVDNLAKVMVDLLAKIFEFNDDDVVDLHLTKEWVEAGPSSVLVAIAVSSVDGKESKK